MSGIAYVNGRYVPKRDAMVHVQDRGYQFADGVYEVIAVSASRLVDLAPHLDRLGDSLSNLEIEWPCSVEVLKLILERLLKRNRLENGIVYLQITRGVAIRNHAFPLGNIRPSIVITTRRTAGPSANAFSDGVKVVTMHENRWRRPDIKSVSLLPNVLAKQFAVRNGAFETWFVDSDRGITEGSSTNAWIVAEGQEIITRPLGHDILAGITRMKLIELARKGNMRVTERIFTVDEALQAEEAFITSTTSLVMPVVDIDGNKIGSGKPGTVTKNLLALYKEHVATGEAL